jgi:AcrR family transcriptional regulator
MPIRLSRAEQQQRTRTHVLSAAERLFVAQGFHATSVDQVAGEAGYTKGAVYSNFASKEDLFFGVYERRAQRGIAEMERRIAAAGGGGRGLDAVALAVAQRRGRRRDDGWLAVFFEFWAHVVRRPTLRARFAAIHARAQEPLVHALEDHAREQGYELTEDPRKLTVAAYAMQLGLSLERLTLPELVDEQLGLRMGRLFLDDLARQGARQGDDDGLHVRAHAAR